MSCGMICSCRRMRSFTSPVDTHNRQVSTGLFATTAFCHYLLDLDPLLTGERNA